MSKEHPDERALAELGWRLDIDREAGEIHVEHADTGNEYVFDTEGNVTVPGDGATGREVRELRDALASALDDQAQASRSDVSETASCRIDCDESTGEVSIQSSKKISMTAPNIELTANAGDGVAISGASVDVSSNSNTNIDSSGVLTLQGALIKLN